MLKKIIPVILALCLVFAMGVMAENADSNETVKDNSVQQRPEHGNFDPTQMQMPEGFDPTQMQMPEGFDPTQMQMPEGFDPSQMQMPQGGGQSNRQNNQWTKNSQGQSQEQSQSPSRAENFGGMGNFGGGMGMGGFSGNMQNGQNVEQQPMGFSGFVKTYSTPIVSMVLLLFAFIFVIFYKRKNY